MRLSRIKVLVVVGCISMMAGVSLLMMGSFTAQAQDNNPPTYVGASECASCHRSLARNHAATNHALALQAVKRDKSIILGDFSQGEDVRQAQFPGEDAPRAFTADDIAYVIGSGQHVQRYLYKVGRDDYMVLPAEWNVASQTWQRLQLGDQWPSEGHDWEQNCAYCHTTGFEVDRGRWQDDGVQCEACHGPASNHVKLAQDAGRRPSDEELTAIRSAIYRSSDPQVCGQCHSRGTSADGHPYPVGYTPGANLTDFFQPVASDAGDHWWDAGHASQPNMQYNEWLTSTHSTSLNDVQKSDNAADLCLNCHSQDYRQTQALIAQVASGDRNGQPPDPLTDATARWSVTCTTCHQQHTDSGQPFELVDEAYALCTSCHTNPAGAVNPQWSSGVHHPVKEMFEGVALVPGIDGVPGAHFSAENGPRCVTCHLQSVDVGAGSRATHSFKPVLPGELDQAPSACAVCHDTLTTQDLQYLVKDTQDTVRSRLATALARLGTITQPQPDTEAATRYQQALEAINFVQNDGSLGVHNYAYTDALLRTAERDLSLLSVAGANLSPTEGPAPTETPTGGLMTQPIVSSERTAASGVRPMTVIVIGLVIAILFTAIVAFFRKPRVAAQPHVPAEPGVQEGGHE